MSNTRVVCSSCQREPKLLADDGGNHEAVCLACGQRDKADDAFRVAFEHAQYLATKAYRGERSKSLDGSRPIKLNGKRHRRSFRWHLVDPGDQGEAQPGG